MAIPYGKQHITEEDIEAVVKTLKSDFLTQGPAVKEFEEQFALYCKSKFAVAVSNGTAALHLAVLSLDIKPGDKVITTPITFAATANSVLYAGGEVVFCDIDPHTYLIDINKLEEILSSSPKGTYKGIIPVDFAGRAVDMQSVKELADRYGCCIIQDACHAPGAYFIDQSNHKQFCGNSIYSDLTVFSFHPVKHIAAGEGGMVTTNSESLYKKLLMLRTHGITKDPALLIENHGKWYYEMHELGYNYRLTDIQAALGTSQLRRANSGLDRRKEIARNYYQAFEKRPYIHGQSGVVEGHAYHLYIIEVDKRKELHEYLHANNIFAQIHYVPLHLMPYYKKFGWKKGDMPNAENYYSKCVSLPIYPTLTNKEQDLVINLIDNFYE
ncbi:UDP-4-amino-4,6-dideoxy-N-acetyl-beta-L-altrosamine transaminase [Marinilabiliaceae bacterium ANBcel2]|nr:UDP-4-amino-4,6-dideoxy-N-acetyl-beta-L-altrosamine transaminase [Marinilabiliaceae bacterium ANBcel2]